MKYGICFYGGENGDSLIWCNGDSTMGYGRFETQDINFAYTFKNKWWTGSTTVIVKELSDE